MLWQMSILSDFSNNNKISYLSCVNDRKLIHENDDISLSRFRFLLEHTSQELDSNTAKLLLENQLKYPSLLPTWTIVRFAFIHLPTDGDGRKSNDVRLIGIVDPIAGEKLDIYQKTMIEDLSLMFKSRTHIERKTKNTDGSISRERESQETIGNVCRVPFIRLIYIPDG
jgi:argonaute-like protein implicated in RNA metabolism and viral defense